MLLTRTQNRKYKLLAIAGLFIVLLMPLHFSSAQTLTPSLNTTLPNPNAVIQKITDALKNSVLNNTTNSNAKVQHTDPPKTNSVSATVNTNASGASKPAISANVSVTPANLKTQMAQTNGSSQAESSLLPLPTNNQTPQSTKILETKNTVALENSSSLNSQTENTESTTMLSPLTQSQENLKQTFLVEYASHNGYNAFYDYNNKGKLSKEVTDRLTQYSLILSSIGLFSIAGLFDLIFLGAKRILSWLQQDSSMIND